MVGRPLPSIGRRLLADLTLKSLNEFEMPRVGLRQTDRLGWLTGRLFSQLSKRLIGWLVD